MADLPFVTKLVVLDSVSSTNDELRRLAAAAAAEGTVVVADHQSAGRGRMGRAWSSAAGLGLYVSVLLRPADEPSQLTRWSLTGAVAVGEACRELSGAPVAIKWPNDILCRGRKLGGVLAEARSQAGRAAELLLGTGINVLHSSADFPAELADRATSLLQVAAGDPPERELVAARYLKKLGELTERIKCGAWSDVARRWERLAPGARGLRVRVAPSPAEPGAVAYEGVTDGLAPDGALRIRREDGGIGTVRMAESITDARPESDRR